LRIGLLGAIVAPSLMPLLGPVLLAGFAPMLIAALVNLRRLSPVAAGSEATAPQVDNPAELPTALSFGAFYAFVLLLAAELTERLGSAGLYAVASASGLTDVDAVTLSSLGCRRQHIEQAVIAIALAFIVNIGAKFVYARARRRQLARQRCQFRQRRGIDGCDRRAVRVRRRAGSAVAPRQ
jgi:uncharacterized membrane protein (DUF4010 family)